MGRGQFGEGDMEANVDNSTMPFELRRARADRLTRDQTAHSRKPLQFDEMENPCIDTRVIAEIVSTENEGRHLSASNIPCSDIAIRKHVANRLVPYPGAPQT
jgi:hypothetical protein